MLNRQYLFDFLTLIPQGKVVSYKFLSEIFQSTPRAIAKILSSNKSQSVYPCYKVVNMDGTISGYNLGVDEKTSRLQLDGVILRDGVVGREHFWKPSIHNVFCGFPLIGHSLIEFGEIIGQIKQILHKYKINYQNTQTPHLTLKFWGNIGLEHIHGIIESLDKHFHTKTDNEGLQIFFNEFDNFNKTVFYLGLSKDQNLTDLYDYNRLVDKYSLLFEDEKPFVPHITLFRSSDRIPLDYLREIKTIIDKYNVHIYLKKISFYIAVDDNYQVPIYDLYV